MSRRKKLILISLFLAIVCISSIIFVIVNKGNKGDLYKTDIVGEWEMGDDFSIIFTETECKHHFGTDYYNYYSEYTLSNIGDGLQYIENDVFIPNYKYFNTIGYYYTTKDIPNSSTFNLTIYSEDKALRNEFDNDGLYIISNKSNNLSDEYELFDSCKYYREKNVIYNAENHRVLFYIIGEEGLYEPVYYKVK